MARDLGPGPMYRSETATQAVAAGAGVGRSFGARGILRPLTGIATVVGIVGLVMLTVALFRGQFTPGVPVTVISERAGLVLNPDAKVKMRDIQVGKVASIEHRGDGQVVLQLALNPKAAQVIPDNVRVDVASSTVFGAKFVQLIPPVEASGTAIRAGQVIRGEHVTVEINTVFEQLTALLDQVMPEQLNQTLSALSTGLTGRGQDIAAMIADANTGLTRVLPGLANLRHDLAAAPKVFGTYADVAPDLMALVDNATNIGGTIVAEQTALDSLLVSVIGLADIGNEVVGGTKDALAEVLHLLGPVTALTREYDEALYCMLAGAVNMAKVPPLRLPGAEVTASLLLGADRYRYPSDLPKVAATGGPQCVGLPQVPFETRPPYVVADVGTNPWEYGNRGIELNTAGIKEFLLGGPVDGPPRNSAQIGMPG